MIKERIPSRGDENTHHLAETVRSILDMYAAIGILRCHHFSDPQLSEIGTYDCPRWNFQRWNPPTCVPPIVAKLTRGVRTASWSAKSAQVSNFAQGQQKSVFLTISQQLLAKAPARRN